MDRLVITQADAAKALGVAERTLQRWRIEGVGPKFVKLGKRVAYTEIDLRDFIARGRRQSTSESAAA